MEASFLGVIRSMTNVSVVVWRTFLLLARRQHALQRDAYSNNTQYRGPLIPKDRSTNMSIRIYMGMNRRLMSLIYNKLDSRGIDGVLGTESELQSEHLSLILAFSHDFYGEKPRLEVICAEKIDTNRATLNLDFRQLLAQPFGGD